MFAIDFDGTIADTNSVKAKWIRNHLGLIKQKYECDRSSCERSIGIENYNLMSEYVYSEKSTMNLGLINNVASILGKLSNIGKIVVITARSIKNKKFAERWIADKRLNMYINNIVALEEYQYKDKADIAIYFNCKFLIDDDIRHLTSGPVRGLFCFHLKENIGNPSCLKSPAVVVRNWDEIWHSISKYFNILD